jgi:hypothetical protein
VRTKLHLILEMKCSRGLIMQRNIETDSWESPALRMHVLFMRETLVLGCTNQQAYTYTRTSLLTAALTYTIKAASSNKLQLKMLKFVVLFATVAICATQVNIIYAHRENLYIFFYRNLVAGCGSSCTCSASTRSCRSSSDSCWTSSRSPRSSWRLPNGRFSSICRWSPNTKP